MDTGLPLTGGTLSRLSPNSTREEQIAVLNSIIDHLNGLLKSQVFSDTSHKRYINGYLPGGWPGGDFGMKISAPGNDVTDPHAQLLYYWDYTTNIQVIYNNNIPTILQGSAPDDGRAGNWQTKPGIDVVAELGG
jgi:hypothetical protein